MRALIIAWGVTGAIVLSLLLWLELSYEPITNQPNNTEMAGEPSHETTTPAATNDDNSHEGEPATTDHQMASSEAEEHGDTGANDDPLTSADTQTNTTPPSLNNQPQNDEKLEERVTRPNFANVAPDVVNDNPTPTSPRDNSSFAFINPPDARLSEAGKYGPLPIIKDQQQPWQTYARNFNRPGDRPRISIIMVNMGLSDTATQNAINQLPPDVILAFSPYGENLETLSDKARLAGHETLIMVPMEPIDFPVNDPGPHTLMVELSPAQNIDRLHYALSRMQGYVGVVNDMGSKFTADPNGIAPIMQDLQKRGLVFVDARTTRLTVAATSAREYGVPRAQNDRYIDNDVSGAQIDRYLRELENIALRSGSAVGIARPYPISIERINNWAASLRDRGIELAPITALANRQSVR